MTVALNHRINGEGEPLILLHGLFGSLDNLGAVARGLQDQWQVHSLDQRNHGGSPHVETMDYPSMAADVIAYMDARGLDQVALLGHSMGGKTAMEVALSRPDRVRSLIVADIAPVTYQPRHDAVLEGLTALDPGCVTSRAQADDALAQHIEMASVRQFLLKNLVRADTGFRWRLNLPVISACYEKLAQAPSAPGPFSGPTLFLKGEQSAYIQERHRAPILDLFPAAELRIIQGTGHWLHAEKTDTFVSLCRRFLQKAG